jgi:hypothetical protein
VVIALTKYALPSLITRKLGMGHIFLSNLPLLCKMVILGPARVSCNVTSLKTICTTSTHPPIHTKYEVALA